MDILNGVILQGKIPNNKMKLLQAWIELHRDELIADWKLAFEGQQLFKIDPLRQFMKPRIKEVTANYTLELIFTNNETGVYDCSKLLDFGVFKEFKDITYFKKAKVQDGTIVWPHEQDICPDTLYLESIKIRSNKKGSS